MNILRSPIPAVFPASLALTALLAGCATPSPAERAAKAERQMDEMMVVYGPACDKLGYKRDSNPWRDCVLNLARKDDMRTYSRMYGYPYGSPHFGYRHFYGPYW
jgi:hypothetical protein